MTTRDNSSSSSLGGDLARVIAELRATAAQCGTRANVSWDCLRANLEYWADRLEAHHQQEKKEDQTRVAPSVPCVAPAGSTAERRTGEVMAAELTDQEGRRYIELPAGVGRYETKPERIYLDPASSLGSTPAPPTLKSDGVWQLLNEADDHKQDWSTQTWHQWFVRLVDAMSALENAFEREAEAACPPVSPVPRFGSEVLCEYCAQVFCPHGEQLHFHHDGCPACASDEAVSPVPQLKLDPIERAYLAGRLVTGDARKAASPAPSPDGKE